MASSPGKSAMVLRSACDGSCGLRELSGSPRSRHQHHHNHHSQHRTHHHHNHQTEGSRHRRTVITDNSEERISHRLAANSSSREIGKGADSLTGRQHITSISEHRSVGFTDWAAVVSKEAEDAERARVLSVTVQRVAEEERALEMSRTDAYTRNSFRVTRSDVVNGSHAYNHSHSRRLVGLEDDTDSDWGDYVHGATVVTNWQRGATASFAAEMSEGTFWQRTWSRSQSAVTTTTSTMWMNAWKWIYIAISKIILFDTWLLSRSRSVWLRRHWLLLLLVIPFIIFAAWAAVNENGPLQAFQSIVWWSKGDVSLDLQTPVPRDAPRSEPRVVIPEEVLQEVRRQLKLEYEDMSKRYESVRKLVERLELNLDLVQTSLHNVRTCCKSDTEIVAMVGEGVRASLNKVGESDGKLGGLSAWMDGRIKDSQVWAEMSEKIIKDTKAAAAAAAVLVSPKVVQTCSGCSDVETIRRIVEESLRIYDADKTGVADYALESAGGSVLSTRCSETFNTRSALIQLFGIPIWYVYNSPRTAIQPGMHPGECWAFKGGEGRLVIQLATAIWPTAFFIEHIPRSLSLDGTGDTAPKDFSVWGLHDEYDPEGIWLGSYTYDRDGPPLQKFLVNDTSVGPFHIVELRINSNHGRLDYTCLYRFRVHGVPLHRTL